MWKIRQVKGLYYRVTGAGNEILQKCISPGGMKGGKEDGVKEGS